MKRLGIVNSIAAIAVVFSLAAPPPAPAAQGDCSQPISNGANPTASDCLFILKAAVRLVTCTPECMCAPGGTLPITATDALACLKKAVGQPITLNCPCGTTTTTTTSSTTTTSGVTTTTTTGSGLPKCSSGKLVSERGTQLDSGWNGLAHGTDLIEGASITFDVVRRCSTDDSVCMTDADCPGGTCDLTCDCDSQNNTVCEITGPTHQRRCLTTLAPCNTNADCSSNQCVQFFGPPLPLSTAGVPACITTFFQGNVTGTADSKTGEGVASAFLRSRVHLGIDVAQPCSRCGAPADNPKVGDTFTCSGGPADGQPCTVEAVSPDFGGASSDCPPEVGANVSGVGLAIRFKQVTTGTASEQARLPCGGQNAAFHPDNGGGVCLDTFAPCSTNADCKRCKADIATPCATNSDCGAGDECAAAPDQPIACGMYCHCGYCGGDPDQPCFSDAECTAPATCVPGDEINVLQQAASNGCDSFVCGTVNNEECCGPDTVSQCVAGIPTNKVGKCSLADFQTCQSNADCGPGQGTCVFSNKSCFEDVITRTGTPSPLGKYCVDDPNAGACTTNADCGTGACVDDTSKPVTVALFCIPPTSSSSINNAGGIPGPGAIQFKSVVFACRCGDGQIGCDEQCDDGNLTNGDGCDQACRIE